VIVFGDSLVSGYELPEGSGFVPKLQKLCDDRKLEANLMTSGVPGDTTTSALERIDNVLNAEPKGVLIVLGANDMFGGVDPILIKENLSKIIDKFQERKIKVLLAGMRAPDNFGSKYQTDFDGVYTDLVREKSVAFFPFFLDGVAGDPAMNLPDARHPNQKGIEHIVENIFQTFKDFVSTLK
jgi:acyl-CoA thioesterase-1